MHENKNFVSRKQILLSEYFSARFIIIFCTLTKLTCTCTKIMILYLTKPILLKKYFSVKFINIFYTFIELTVQQNKHLYLLKSKFYYNKNKNFTLKKIKNVYQREKNLILNKNQILWTSEQELEIKNFQQIIITLSALKVVFSKIRTNIVSKP